MLLLALVLENGGNQHWYQCDINVDYGGYIFGTLSGDIWDANIYPDIREHYANSNNGVLATITFGDSQAATMNTSMTDADFSGKYLGASGAIIVAAFLPKCQ